MASVASAPPLIQLPNNPGRIYVNKREKTSDDRVIRCIRNVGLDFVDCITADYVMGSSCVITIELSYHLLHENYVRGRMKSVGKNYKVRVLIVIVDCVDNMPPLLQLNKLCFNEMFTLILTWSNIEAARYIECLKIHEAKAPTSIQEKIESGFEATLTKVLTTIPSVNKTDVGTLMKSFDSFRGICEAEEHHLILCQGIGETKMRRMHQILHQPLKKKFQKSVATNNVCDTSTEPSLNVL